MTRSMVLVFLLALLVFPGPLTADENAEELAQAKAEVEKARGEVTQLKTRLAELYKEVEHDFKLVGNKRWTSLSGPYLEALAAQTASTPEADLAASFRQAGVLSPVVSDRLAAAAAKLIGEAATPPPPAEVLAAALKVVFPERKFEDCWDRHFLDLPLAAEFKAAGDALTAAERRLVIAQSSSDERPEIPPGMVLIPRGRFIYGPWEEGWQNDLKTNKESKERLEAYFIDVHEVTNADYRDFVASLTDAALQTEYLATGFKQLPDGTITIPPGQELWPVRGVTLEAAAAYAESIGKRLPTEEEWEKAARGEKGLRWPWGNEFQEENANVAGSGLERPAPVGSFPKDLSAFGVLDMAGNVSELTATLDERRPYKGKAAATDSVIYRGGNYKEGETSATGTYRWIMSAVSGRSGQVGFRCVISEKAWKRGSR